MATPAAAIIIRNTGELPPPPPSTEEPTASVEAPHEFLLEQNYPNPFNPKTDFGFRIPARPDDNGRSGGADFSATGGSASGGGLVTLKIYDVLGREVATIVNEN